MLTTTTTTGRATPASFDRLRQALIPLFVARESEIEALFLALVAKTHLFFLSKPGTAKTMLFKEFLKRVYGAEAFYSIFDPTSEDGLILGPPSIPKLIEGKREREIDGYLPGAELWLADEIWNASAPVLQAMHQVTLERKFKQGSVEVDIDLWTMLAAANGLPTKGAGLEAIWDRIPLRLVVGEIVHPDQMRALFNLGKPVADPEKVLDWADVVDAHDQAMALPISNDADEAFIGILVASRIHQVQLSGRRMLEARRIAQANAWLLGDTEVRPEHFDFLVDFLWDEAEQREPISRVVLEVTSPLRAECNTSMTTIASVRDEITAMAKLDKADPARRQGKTPLFSKIITLANEIVSPVDGLEARATSARDRNAVNDLSEHVQGLAHDFLVNIQGTQPIDILASARKGTLAA